MNRARGLRLIEVAMVVAILLPLAALYLLPSRRARVHTRSGSCSTNLKQIGIAFQLWASDHNGQFPMQLSVTNGGTLEYLSGPETFRHFEVMSNDLNTPVILFCPNETDRSRKRAQSFGAPSSRTDGSIAFSGNSNLSYFLGIDATSTNFNMFLAGDRNITNGSTIRNGLLTLTTNRPTGWTGEIHAGQGYVLVVDGSVHNFSTSALRPALENTGVATYRLAMP